MLLHIDPLYNLHTHNSKSPRSCINGEQSIRCESLPWETCPGGNEVPGKRDESHVPTLRHSDSRPRRTTPGLVHGPLLVGHGSSSISKATRGCNMRDRNEIDNPHSTRRCSTQAGRVFEGEMDVLDIILGIRADRRAHPVPAGLCSKVGKMLDPVYALPNQHWYPKRTSPTIFSSSGVSSWFYA